jgi:hypothetical protein
MERFQHDNHAHDVARIAAMLHPAKIYTSSGKIIPTDTVGKSSRLGDTAAMP